MGNNSVPFKKFFSHLATLAVFLRGVLGTTVAHAQIQRSIVNPSFEAAFTGPRAAGLNQFFTLAPGQWIALDAGEIPGWETTHPIIALGCPNGSFSYTPQYNCTPIEIWANSFNGVTPPNGIVLA